MGKEGGNNVASCIITELRLRGLLSTDYPVKELTIIMDNCGGQNKNNYVLRLALFLVEAGFFEKVTFLFYIVGHTKNAADRWFNILKRRYKYKDIYTFQQMISAFDNHDDLSIREVKKNDFLDYNEFLNNFYVRFKPNTIYPGHVFLVEKSNPTEMTILEDQIVNCVPKKQNFAKGCKDLVIRKQSLLRYFSTDMKHLVSEGVKDIKKVELFKKYHTIIPDEYKDVTCLYPGDDVMEKVKTERNEKKKKYSSEKKGKCEKT